MKTPDQPAHPLTRDHTLLNAARAEITRLRAEVERLNVACDKFSNSEIAQGDWKARAEKAEDIIRSLCRISNIPIGSDAATNPAMKGTL